MARPLRIDIPGGHYHITSRGVGRQDIFFDDEDREEFLDRLDRVHQRTGIVIHAYCLMTSHYHLDIETPEGYLSRSLQWLNETYASSVNRRWDRVGHLFQGRFHSAVIEAEQHLAALTRYIHLNPVRAGIAKKPADYQWSSYRSYIGVKQAPRWLSMDFTLGRFGRNLTERREEYRSFVEGEAADRIGDPLQGLSYGAILGGEQFVAQIRERVQRERVDPEVAQMIQAASMVSLSTVGDEISSAYGCSRAELNTRGRKGHEARDVAIYLSREMTGESLTRIGNRFGGIRPSAVSLAHRRIVERIREDEEFGRRVEDLSHRIRSREQSNIKDQRGC